MIDNYCFKICLAASFFVVSFGFNNVINAEDQPAQSIQEKLNLVDLDEVSDPVELLEIIKSDWVKNFDVPDVAEEEKMMRATLAHIIQAADKIISNPQADEETALAAVRNKMQAMGVLARTGDPKATSRAVEMAKDLQNDKRPLVAREGKMIVLSSRLLEIPKLNKDQRAAFVSELIELFSVGKMTEREVQIARVTARLFEQVNRYDSAQQVLSETAVMLKKSESPRLRKISEEFVAIVRRLGLPGNPIKLSGKTLEGKDFDIKELKGKVVLVQFWASWCPSCLQEMPNMMRQYNAYHDAGFEIVGVNLDDSISRANGIVNDMQLPWLQLFSADANALGMQNANAVYYGINMLPRCILIDRKGNVIKLQALGKTLNQELEQLFVDSEEK